MEWTVRIGEKDYVARTDDELLQWYREGRLQPETLVFHPVLRRWLRAAEMEELRTVARVPLSMREQSSGDGISAKTTGILIAVGIGVIALLMLISSISERSAARRKAAEEAAQAAERQRIKSENISSARASLTKLDPAKQAEEFARQCDTLTSLASDSVTADEKARCAAANFQLAKLKLERDDLPGARQALGAAVAGGTIADGEYKRLDAQLTRRETVAREKAEAESKIRAAKEAKERAKTAALARAAYGEVLRTRFLDKNLDIKVSVTGAKKDRITLKFILFNDVWSHRIQQDGLLRELRDIGFKRVTLTDGYDYTVYWDFDE